MGRPHKYYKVGYLPRFGSYKPEGCECYGCIEVTPEEIESLRLKNVENFDQTKAAKRMGISQSTFQRILARAYKKVSKALIQGAEIRITKN